MKHLFVPFEIAKLAKEKGFKEECFGFWSGTPGIEKSFKLNVCSNKWHLHKNNTTAISAPIYQQIIYWLLNDRNLIISTLPEYRTVGFRGFQIENSKLGVVEVLQQGMHLEYYDALNAAIIESFSLI